MTTAEIIAALVAGAGSGPGGEPVREAILAGGRYDVAMRVLDLVDGLADEYRDRDAPYGSALNAVSNCLVTARP